VFELGLQQLANGVLTGATYAMVAIGLVLIFSVMRAINFAHGEFYMLGALIAYTAIATLDWPYAAAVAGALLASVGLGLVASVTVMERLFAAPVPMAVVATIGLQMALQNGAQLLWGPTPKYFKGGWTTPVSLGGEVGVVGQQLVIFAVAVVAFVALEWTVRRTRIGKAMRAVSQSRETCLVVGIDVDRVARVTFTSGVTLAGLAGALVAPVLVNVGTTMGLQMVLKCFAIIVLGGLGSVRGALLGGILLGVVESFVAGYLTLQLRDAVAFLALTAVLTLRPHGLFGQRVRI
jgi:branched-chain amino acid transport system permease protein